MRLKPVGLCAGLLAASIHKFVSLLPHFKFKFAFLLIVIAGIHPGIVRAQTEAIIYTVSYVEDSKTYYQITDPLHDFTIADQVKLMPEITRDSVIREMYRDNKFQITVYHLENNMFEDWMTQPGKTVIEETKVELFDKDGSLITSMPHTEKYKEKYQDLQNYLNINNEDVIPSFIYLEGSTKELLNQAGFLQTDLGNNYIKYTKDSIELMFNDEKHINELIVFHGDGTFNYSIRKGFKFNELEQLVPLYRVEKRWDGRFPAQCVQRLKIIQYPYYVIAQSEIDPRAKLAENKTTGGAIGFVPNPAITKIVISIPACETKFHIVIYDNAGRSVYRNSIDAGLHEFVADVESLDPGVYVIRIFNDVKTFSETFIKN
ncbi:MAG: T9SS type A sorting domain-containing protein [Chitinophagales bacterium]